MDYKEKYEKAVQAAMLAKQNTESAVTIGILEEIFPELAESKDEKIRRNIIAALKGEGYYDCDLTNECIAWLEKQGQVKEPFISQHENKTCKENDDSLTSNNEKMRNAAINACKYMVDNFENSTKQYEDAIIWLEKQGTPAKLSEEEQNRFAKGVLTSCAMSFIDYLDAHKHEGKMCVSNGECKDIENAFHNSMWDRLHRYYCKYIEKRGGTKDKLNTMLDDSLSRETKESWNKFLDEQKSVWSREDEQNLNAALGYINDEHLCRWLKDVIHAKYDKLAWSEEDERILRTIISDGIRGAEFDMVQVDWLKSLKERYIWKPSDEQIKACKEVYADLLSAKGFDICTVNSELNRLEKDLKKLKA